MNKKLPYPEHLARGYPPGTVPDRRQILKCSQPGAWYESMVGQIITVHYFVTFGCWDTEGRWLCYYDLSAPIKKPFEFLYKPFISIFKNLFRNDAYYDTPRPRR